MHALNKLISTEISSARLAWSALFEIFEALNALSAFTHLIVCFTSSSVMHELNETVRNINDFAMSLTFTWEDKKKNFLRSILIFFSNVVVIWSMSLRFSDENWESFLDSWLSILTHFAKRHIDLSTSLSSCICDLKCAYFVCRMILFLWSLWFRYSFHASNVSCVFHIICSRSDFITTSKQLWFQKSFAQFDDFVKKINFSMIFCNTLIILHTLSFIIVLLSRERFKDRCIRR
jgi:hypothetical protein